jgi:hypothetical protein
MAECVYCAVRSVTWVHLPCCSYSTRTNGRGLRKLARSSVVPEICVACLEQQVLAVFRWSLLEKKNRIIPSVRGLWAVCRCGVVMWDFSGCRWVVDAESSIMCVPTQSFCCKFIRAVTTIQGPNLNGSNNSCVQFFGLFATLSLCTRRLT